MIYERARIPKTTTDIVQNFVRDRPNLVSTEIGELGAGIDKVFAETRKCRPNLARNQTHQAQELGNVGPMTMRLAGAGPARPVANGVESRKCGASVVALGHGVFEELLSRPPPSRGAPEERPA